MTDATGSTTADVSFAAPIRKGPRGHLLLPGGFGRSTLSMGDSTPFVARGEGYRIWDNSGRELIDANNNFTVAVHGHAHPEIIEAAEGALRNGSSFGLPNPYEWDHAEVLLERLPWLDQVRYVNSGTEAVMTAIRVARAATGRDGTIMLKGSYHGTSDTALVAGGGNYLRGVPQGVIDDVTVLPLNDIDALREAVERDPERYATLVMDLLPNRAGLVSITPEFAAAARELTAAHEIALIFDEVISFRLGYNGLGAVYGIEPDMVTLGKVVGGGFPVGAVVGREELMRELSVEVPKFLEHGGTFSGNPVSMAAGAASLQLLDAASIDRLNSLGDQVRGSIEARVAPVGWEVRGRGSIFRPFVKGAERMDADLQRRLWWAAYERGVLLMQTNCAALSTPMTDEVVVDLGDRLTAAVLEVADRADG
ncbi:MAG: aminotransferase class III-fold pyridoxal phosphate-dependent enzyme [Actinobacteria bacterium]|nr:aminotransferase class III-fold pyridoxal phosphate-dependent enzyme [Actinomycetota bacterium]